MAGELEGDAGGGAGAQTHIHVEGQADVALFQLLGVHKPAGQAQLCCHPVYRALHKVKQGYQVYCFQLCSICIAVSRGRIVKAFSVA